MPLEYNQQNADWRKSFEFVIYESKSRLHTNPVFHHTCISRSGKRPTEKKQELNVTWIYKSNPVQTCVNSIQSVFRCLQNQ